MSTAMSQIMKSKISSIWFKREISRALETIIRMGTKMRKRRKVKEACLKLKISGTRLEMRIQIWILLNRCSNRIDQQCSKNWWLERKLIFLCINHNILSRSIMILHQSQLFLIVACLMIFALFSQTKLANKWETFWTREKPF